MTGEERQLYLGLAAIAATLLGTIWLTGALAGLAFGDGWTSVGLSELAVTALSLPSHLGDPRAAWPRGARASLPGAPGLYASAVLVFVGLCGLALTGHRFLKLDELLALGRSRRRAPSASWASRRDLAPLRVAAPQRRRLTLGWSGRALLAAQERQSVIAFAPTESHKTTGLAIPALLEWQGPVLATSVKSDLLIDTVARRQRLGEVMVFDPALVTGLEPARATPLWGAGTWRGAMRVAHWLAAAARTGAGGLQDADFWYAAAEKLLAPLL
ncbi:MAG TPA: type IV secretory system conjugative DNA transfer family protein, partial [Solirubrobacterales bacterium]|nr:type IV secretory system conjugative DNA transfer family protein [Solirubrobacterales bacterium]